MKKALFIDSTVREESRTLVLANSFINELKGYEIKHLKLANEDLKPLLGDFFNERQTLLEQNNLNHPRFKYAHEFKEADLIIIAAPFWDLSYPALLKIYIENISVDGITFTSTAEGLKGLCKSNNLVYLTTRGGFYENDEMEQAYPYIYSLTKFFGIENFYGIGADGMDVEGFDGKESLNKAISKAKELAKKI